jgi:hypothetical protein
MRRDRRAAELLERARRDPHADESRPLRGEAGCQGAGCQGVHGAGSSGAQRPKQPKRCRNPGQSGEAGLFAANLLSPRGEDQGEGGRPRKYVFPARMPLGAAPPHLPVAAQRALLSDSRRASPRGARRLRATLPPIALCRNGDPLVPASGSIYLPRILPI